MRNLLKRGNVYYVSVGIAPSLHKILGSKTSHIVRSLKTRDHAEAVSMRKEAIHKIQGELLAIKRAAKENGVKAAADQWKKKIAAKEFDASKFVAEVARVQRTQGEAAAAELSRRPIRVLAHIQIACEIGQLTDHVVCQSSPSLLSNGSSPLGCHFRRDQILC